ncbi:MAG: glycerophosphodiester phosphodiesterase [Promethearchaeota archaeon]
MNSEIYCIGHRGCRIGSDENTFTAFTKALKNGADCIEFDVHKTKDNKLIIIHDITLERTTNGFGKVNELNYEEIKNFKTNLKGCPIPLLSEVIDAFKNKINFLIELKGENIRNLLIKLLKQKDILNSCIFSSRNLSELFLLKTELPKSQICYNITKGIGLSLKKIQEQKKIPKQINIISLDSRLITQDFINLCHNQNVLVYSWNFIKYKKPIEKIKLLITLGIDGILFDDCQNIPSIKKWVKSN